MDHVAVFRAALADKGYSLESLTFADDDIFNDYEHVVIQCRGQKPISCILLSGDISCREVLLGIVERFCERVRTRDTRQKMFAHAAARR